MTGRADGIERLRRWTEEQRGVPPAFGRLGASLDRVAPGATAVRLPLTPELLLPDGRSTAGTVALLADFGVTTPVIASLPDLRGVSTVSMTVDHLAPAPLTGALVTSCVASPYAGGALQHASGAVRDADGHLVAQTSGWLVPTPAEQVAVERVGLVQEPPARDVFDLLQTPPGAAFPLVARDALSNAIGSLHGGVGALACVAAAEQALPDLRPVTSAFAFLRPTPRDGTVQVAATVVRAGRRTGLVEVSLTDGEDRLLVTARIVLGS